MHQQKVALLKLVFFDALASNPFVSNADILDRLFIMGDFNYSFIRPRQMRYIPEPWLTILHSSFSDCLTSPFQHPLPNFHSNASIQSTIDYIYTASTLYPQIYKQTIIHINRTWSDYNILSIDYCVGSNPTRRGVWRFNPLLLQNKPFLNSHTETL